MTVPPVVSSWLSSAYPSIKVNPTWLNACCAYIATNTPGIQGPAMIQRVQQQLMLASLSDVALSGALPEDLSDVQSTQVASQKGGILVQLEGIFEIGHSTLSVSDAHKQRKEDAKMGVDRARIVGNIEDDAEENQGPAKFPRAMLMLQVGDGFRSMKAMEYKRIPELSMDDTPLGCKVRT
jgi:RecQ-mediated genome instability protein 1